MKTTLSERLKEARLARGLTQKALGDLVGVSQAAIQKIETGKANQTTKIVEIANALGVRAEWLSSGVGNMSDSTVQPIQSTVSHSKYFKELKNVRTIQPLLMKACTRKPHAPLA